MLLLDCWIHDKWEIPWTRKYSGNTEIIARGGQCQSAKGKQEDRPRKDFTDGLAFGLTGFLRRLVAQWDREVRTGRYRKKVACKTLCHVMSKQPLYFKPRRINVKNEKPGPDTVKMLFWMDPNEIKVTGKLKFCAKMRGGLDPNAASECDQGSGLTFKQLEAEDEDEDEDEGVDMAGPDASVVSDDDDSTLFCQQ